MRLRLLLVYAITIWLVLASPVFAEYLSEKLKAFLDPNSEEPKPKSGILCRLSGARTAGDTPPPRQFDDLSAFLTHVYAAPQQGRTAWHGDTRKHELHIVGGIVPPYKPEVAAFLKDEVPQAEANLAGAIRLFDWLVDNTPKRGTQPQDKRATRIQEVFAEVIGTPGVDSIYCNQATSLFRTVLALRGITSRVVCAFADAEYGKKGGHTFLEVWDPAQEKWLFFDPKFCFYSTTMSAAEVLYKTSHLSTYIGHEKPALTHHDAGTTSTSTVARTAAPLWYIENGETGERTEYRDAAFFGTR